MVNKMERQNVFEFIWCDTSTAITLLAIVLWEPSAAKQRLGKHVSTEMQFLDKQSVAR
jgi:hypothetical protein